jgi:hypothetical protein
MKQSIGPSAIRDHVGSITVALPVPVRRKLYECRYIPGTDVLHLDYRLQHNYPESAVAPGDTVVLEEGCGIDVVGGLDGGGVGSCSESVGHRPLAETTPGTNNARYKSY